MASAVLSGSNEHYWRETNNNAAYMRNYANAPDYDPDFRRRLPPPPNSNPNPNLNRAHNVPVRRPPPHVSSHNAAAPSPRSAPSHAPSPAPPSTSFSNSDQRKCVTYHLSSYSRRELKDLRKRLISELDQVRALRTRIEAVPEPRIQIPVPPPPAGLKTKSISKGSAHPRPMPAAPLSSLSSQQVSKLTTSMMRKCSQMLNKLMKHKHGWVFNKPVDVVSLGLHDYHTIIRTPMDLGTVKSRMSKKEYRTPLAFAGDVRLTFNNAMIYNPKGQDVYLMAQDLLSLFESMFNPAFHKYESEMSGVKKAKQKRVSLPLEPALQDPPQVGPVGLSAKTGKTEKAKVRKRDSNGEEKSRKRDMKGEKLRKMDKLVENVEVESRKVGMNVEVESRKVGINVEEESRKVNVEAESRKKGMTFEEKSRLAIGLQELPQPMLDEMVKIMKKRNIHLAPDSDEIEMEFDIDAIDNETLWELNRLVKDHERMRECTANGESSPQNELSSAVQPEEFLVGSQYSFEQKNKKGDAGEEDVDIGDEAPVNFPPLEIEKDGSSSNSGSSSSSGSSSTSDSDSSGSDSDGESVQSPFVQARGEDPDMA